MEKCKEDKVKENLLEAIDLLNKSIEENKTPIKVVLKRLDERMKYISKKLSNCKGYSEEEKKIRYDEILNVMEIIKEVFNVEL